MDSDKRLEIQVLDGNEVVGLVVLDEEQASDLLSAIDRGMCRDKSRKVRENLSMILGSFVGVKCEEIDYDEIPF